MTVGKLKEFLASYKDDAEFQIAYVYDKTNETVYSNDFYDMWIEGEDEKKDEFGERIRNINSNIVYFKIFR